MQRVSRFQFCGSSIAKLGHINGSGDPMKSPKRENLATPGLDSQESRPSDSDLQMLQWTAAGSGPSFCLYVHHDNSERE